MIYLVCFAASAGFAYFANKTNNRKKFYIFSVCSILVMVLLAGLRDYSIGIDTLNYYNKAAYWKGAVESTSLIDYLNKYFSFGYSEPLFAILLGVIAKLTGNFTVFLIICHAIILSCVYIGIVRLKEYINPVFVLILYYLLYFNHSLNMIRQHMAMAIVFVALVDVLNRKQVRYLIFIFLAVLFHNTAVIAFGLLVIYWIINYNKGKLENIGIKHRFLFTVVSLSAVVFLFAPIINFLVDIGALNEKYLYFLNNRTEPALIASGVVVIGLLAVFLFRKEITEKYKDANFFALTSICYLILMQLSLTVAYGRRIALHFALADLITLGIVENSQKNKKTQWLVRVGIIGVCFVYWLYIYILKNAGKTHPYVFFI